jgi:cell wall-associated NlpC family hydrolase
MVRLLVLISVLALSGCGATHVSTARPLPPTPTTNSDEAAGRRLIAHAQAIANAGNLHAGERRDCSGFVMDVFRSAGRPLSIPAAHRRYPNVSAMLHDWGAAEQRTFRGTPRPGDVVFFRDTIGALDGRITHVALVERVRSDGTVELIHYIGGRVRRDPMNLSRPKDHTVNAWLRKKERKGDPSLAGELFVAYARF